MQRHGSRLGSSPSELSNRLRGPRKPRENTTSSAIAQGTQDNRLSLYRPLSRSEGPDQGRKKRPTTPQALNPPNPAEANASYRRAMTRRAAAPSNHRNSGPGPSQRPSAVHFFDFVTGLVLNSTFTRVWSWKTPPTVMVSAPFGSLAPETSKDALGGRTNGRRIARQFHVVPPVRRKPSQSARQAGYTSRAYRAPEDRIS